MRILICDANLEISEQLKKLLQIFFKKKSLKVPEIIIYNNGKSLISDTGRKDIVFMDIVMPNLNGIYIGSSLKKENPNTIIFIVTSHLEYLDEAMRFHAFRYLPKPLDKNRIYRNMEDALQLYNSNTLQIPIETKKGVYVLSTNDIICIEADEHKVIVHTKNHDYESVQSMKYWISTLNIPYFFLSHRSYIVNLQYISDFDHSIINLYNGKYRAYLTKRRYPQFKEAYLLYYKSLR